MNARIDFPDDGDDRQIGDAIQLQLATHAAFGKARGKARVSKATRRASSSAAS